MSVVRTVAVCVLSTSLVCGALALACGPAGFPDQNIVTSVRILAARSDLPYAPPGATVHTEVLAVDGRDGSAKVPMRVYWLPFVCVNPPNDAYYACFAALEPNPSGVAQRGGAGAGGQDGSTAALSFAIAPWDGGPEASVPPGRALAGNGATLPDGGLLALIPPGKDISSLLVSGSRVVFDLPTDIVSSHVPVKGATFPYGLAVVFNIACAGHVQVIALDAGNAAPLQIPFGCFDSQGNPVSADDYVIGYAEVYAFAPSSHVTNKNPVISSFSFAGKGVPIDAGTSAPVSVIQCDAGDKCGDATTIVGVPDASWEPDPQDPGPDGGPLGEQIWVDYYSSFGSLKEDAILIFDPVEGRVVPPHQEDFYSQTSQKGTMWAVVHDNRGGAAWLTVPIQASK
jgi:hypothetical protein